MKPNLPSDHMCNLQIVSKSVASFSHNKTTETTACVYSVVFTLLFGYDAALGHLFFILTKVL